jgi:hypothetical protein
MAKKVTLPRAKTQMGFLDKLFSGIGGLSAVINHPNLRRSIQGTTPSGQRASAAMLRNYGKFGRMGMGLLNPWTAVPYALLAGAQYGVGKAFDPYRDETGKIGAAGHEQLLQQRLAREDLYKRRTQAREDGVGFLERLQMKSDGGIARLL